jgi:hypothetical protein
MTSRSRAALALAAAVLIGAAIYVSTARRTEQPAGVGELLYPSLEAALDRVTAIRITGAGETTAVTLERAESGWGVAERGGFPADAGRVRTLLLGLAQARTVEQKTSVPANYAALGVEDLSGNGATGTGVELEGPAENVSLIVGKSTGARSTFVRRKGEDTSWQIGTGLTVERDPARWLDTELLDVGADRVQSVEFIMAGKRPWSAAKSSRADSSFSVKGKPAGAKSDSGNVDRIASSLAGLRLTDVRRASDDTDLKPTATATYRTFDGLVLAVEGYTEGDKRYVRVEPSLDEAAARRFFVAAAPPAGKDAAPAAAEKGPVANPTASTAPATGKPAVAASESKSDVPAASGASAPASTPEAVLARTRDEVAKLATRLSGWEFEIPSWNYDSIFAR